MSRFTFQLHDGNSLHFDLRLRVDDILECWAVPKGPSLDPSVRRLAVRAADRPLPAADFEGVHPGRVRGSGAVIIWDEGPARLVADRDDHLSIVFNGHKLRGRFGLVHTGGRRWVLVKADDGEARRGSDVVADRPRSVRSGCTWQQLAAGIKPAERRSGRGLEELV